MPESSPVHPLVDICTVYSTVYSTACTVHVSVRPYVYVCCTQPMALHCTVMVWATDLLAVRAEQHLKVKELDQEPLANKTPEGKKHQHSKKSAYVLTYGCAYTTHTTGKAIPHLTAEACTKQRIVRMKPSLKPHQSLTPLPSYPR